MKPFRFTLALVSLLVAVMPTVGNDAEDMTFFEKKIRPVLVEKCYRCHSSAEKIRGGLAVDSKEALAVGGDSGPAVVAKDLEKSVLIKALRYTDPDLQMPPKGKLPAHVIADFEQWVKMGAPDPRTTGKKVAKGYGVDIEEGRKFWAFQPPKMTTPAKTKMDSWAYNDIDRFLLAKMAEKKIRPSKDASRETLIRRTYFALVGLPPSPEEIDAFVNDKSPKAYAKVVDRLLASPQFGERWGRHWLDVARYAESSGGGRSLIFPEAWRYRDYVIKAFNDDKPYNRFVMEQIAGDLLEAKTEEERQQQLIALAYLLLGPINYEQQDKPLLESDIVDEQLDSLGRGFLGMTIGCARCHDHKFDPIPQKDYYAMAGILHSTKFIVHSNVSKWMERPLPMSPEKEKVLKAHNLAVAQLKTRVNQLRKVLNKSGLVAAKGVVRPDSLPGIIIDDNDAKKIGKWNKSTFMNTFVGDGYLYANRGDNTLSFNPEILKEGIYEVRLAYLANSNRATNTLVRIFHSDGEDTVKINQKKVPVIDGRWHSLGKYRFEKGDQWFVMVMTKDANGAVVADAVQFIHEDEIPKTKVITKKEKSSKKDMAEELAQLEKELKALEAKAPKRTAVMAVGEGDKIGDFYLCIRGNIHNKGPEVPRGFLQVATNGAMPQIPDDQSGRLQLAKWLGSRDNPLTARVMANRIWHHLFGQGIVLTVDNFGATGSSPSHVELLDYLAIRFMEENWSVKTLIREIMLSHAYQQASGIDENDPNTQLAIKADVDNRLLWRQNRQRLEAEVIRDAILKVSGQLDLTMGGPAFRGNVNERGFTFKDSRRSVYTPVFRNNLLELFEVFDFPDPNMVKGARSSSTVAPQALFLMNNSFIIDQAKNAAKNSLTAAMNDETRIQHAYRLTLGRQPTEREQHLASTYLRAQGDNAQLEAWSRFYQVLYSCVDFRYAN